MSTRKRKQDEELVALPSDESEEEEEYVLPFPSITPLSVIAYTVYDFNWDRFSFKCCWKALLGTKSMIHLTYYCHGLLINSP
jgi:hypothetical protein